MKIKKLLIGCGAIFATLGLISCSTAKGNDSIVEEAKYTVTYDYKNGNPSTSIQVSENKKIVKPSDPTKEDFIFKGWYQNEDYQKEWNFDEDVVIKNMTLYAKWEKIEKYSVSFNMHGHGTAPANGADTTTLPNPLPSVVDVEGWHFVGWYLDEAFTTLAEAGKALTENVVLHAKWEINKYTVTFDSKDGSSVNPQTVEYNQKATRPEPTKEGHIFAGWYKDEAYNHEFDFNNTPITDNITLYAKWVERSTDPNKVKVIFNPKDGVLSSPAEVLIEVGGKVSKPTDPTRVGYTFKGWFENPTDPAGVPFDFENKTITVGFALYAKWEKIVYSISYNMNGHGTAPATLNSQTALPSPLPPVADVEGWHFVGWYTDSACTTAAVAGATITENTVLHAKWEQIFYSISYNTNGKGEQPENINKASNLPSELPILTDSVESFAGWYLDASFNTKATAGMLLTEDVTLYAKWVAKTTIIIDEAQGYSEGAYLEWKTLEGCKDYHVYYKKSAEDDTHYKQIDSQLIREYPNNYRADAVGLSAGNYTLKVVPVYENVEFDAGKAEENVVVSAHDRSGFGFSKNSTYKTSSGAYNDDGTLKANAKVVYVSASNAKTVTCTINGTERKGFQDILAGKQSVDTTPLVIRLLGLIQISDLDTYLSSEEGIQVKGKNNYSEMNITIEGIGEDATCKGFGFLIRNCGNVEFRNFAIMNQLDDAISIDTSNCNLWIHHMDLYYGQAGGDSDQAKGDGFVDIKKSQYCSVSYNHFYDSGKCCLIDASVATSGGSDYLTYHHNWFDHSDSRHPRVRNGQNIHVYNNYYDGVSKYGVGAAAESSIFVEANYFRNTKHPMMIAGQGSDIDPSNVKGTFSGENGGMIKAYNNKIVGGGTFISQTDNSTSFDAVVVANREDKVTGYSASKGGHTYSNFDTDSSVMYQYTADNVDDVVEIVTKHAGRINGGDLPWTFDNSVEDENYAVISGLKQAIVNYKSKLVRVLGIEGTQGGGNTGGGDDPGTGDNPPEITDGVEHNFTTSGKESSVFTITGNLATNKGTVTYKNLTLTQCLKLESSTKISFNTSETMTLILVFAEPAATINVDGKKQTATDGIISISLAAGSHTLTKADKANLFYIELGKSS